MNNNASNASLDGRDNLTSKFNGKTANGQDELTEDQMVEVSGLIQFFDKSLVQKLRSQ